MSEPAQIQLKSFDASKVDIAKTLEEIEIAKKQIEVVRQEIKLFLTTLATVPDGCTEMEFFEKMSRKVFDLRRQLADYLTKYNNLIPYIELTRQSKGFSMQKFEIVNLKPYLSDRTAKRNQQETVKQLQGANVTKNGRLGTSGQPITL